MTEEFLTKSLLSFLLSRGWKIISFDFPQSGTGILLHPKKEVRKETKNKDGIIPDIITCKKNVAMVFENKSFYYKEDFSKMHRMRESDIYDESLFKVLPKKVTKVYYGIGIPFTSLQEVDENDKEMIDFLISITQEGYTEAYQLPDMVKFF